jgi:hypothetical protein
MMHKGLNFKFNSYPLEGGGGGFGELRVEGGGYTGGGG